MGKLKSAIKKAQRERRDVERCAGMRNGWPLAFLPKILPPGWRKIDEADDGARYRHDDGMVLIFSASLEDDKRRWVHVSASFKERLPTWAELKTVKDVFIGKDKKAIQVLPEEKHFINLHPYVLHLWYCLDGMPIPEFSASGVSI